MARAFPATEILYNTSEGHRKLAVAIQQMWKKHLNIDVTLLNQEWKVYLNSVSMIAIMKLAEQAGLATMLTPITFSICFSAMVAITALAGVTQTMTS